MVREILVDWTTASGSGKVSVFYFDEATAVGAQRSALSTFLGAADAVLSTTASWVMRTTGTEYDDVTGALTGAWTDTTPYSGAGGAAGQAADATQVLVRWDTGQIVNGRFLKGRTYLPALASGNLNVGNLAAAARTTVSNAAAAFVTASVGFIVWHRPVAGAGGDPATVTGSDVWTELAVLRRRRG